MRRAWEVFAVWEELERFCQQQVCKNSEVKKWFQELTELQFKEIQQIQKRQYYYGLNAMENK